MFDRRIEERRRRRTECPECGAPRLLAERLNRYRVEHEELWAAIEKLTSEREELIRRLSRVADAESEFPPPLGTPRFAASTGRPSHRERWRPSV